MVKMSHFFPDPVKTPRLMLDVWNDIKYLSCGNPSYKKSSQIVYGAEEPVELPSDITCDDIIYNMSLVDQKNKSQLTGNYDDDFPDLNSQESMLGDHFISLDHSFHPFQKKVKTILKTQPKSKFKKGEFYVVEKDILNDEIEEALENDLDVADFESVPIPEMKEDDWELLDHPGNTDFEIVDDKKNNDKKKEKKIKSADSDNIAYPRFKKQGKKSSSNRRV